MTIPPASFSGMSPDAYDSGLGPMFFEPYAADIARRVQPGAHASVLEIAAGTGIVTRHLLKRLPPDARLIATDFNEAMLAVAKAKLPADARLQWRSADACSLPFDNGLFDAVVCQFGLMFFPDKPGAVREARRVLKPSGVLHFNVWGSLDDNPIARLAHETIGSFFHADPPRFYTIPFGFQDRPLIERMLREAGFGSVECDTVDFTGESETAEKAAKGLVFGTPVLTAIEERGGTPTAIMHAVAARLADEGGASRMRLPMRALVFRALNGGS